MGRFGLSHEKRPEVVLGRDETVVDHRFAKIKEAFERIPGADVYGAKCAPEDIPNLAHPVEQVQGGVHANQRTRDDQTGRSRCRC